MKIEKGKKYRCVKTDSYFFTENKIYYSNKSGYIIDNEGDHIKPHESKFELVEEPSTEDLLKRIEALEQKFDLIESEDVLLTNPINGQLTPCPTAAKFKRISDHAQAITNEIATPKEDVIYVPDGILHCYGDIINGNKTLFHDSDGWNVMSSFNIIPSKPNQFKLVPVKREELKVGDVAFRRDNESVGFKYLNGYCIILEDGHQFWNGKNCQHGNSDWKHWYKVVEA